MFCSELESLLKKGLRVMTICNDGSGRSRTVAETLCKEQQIPAVRLIGGLSQFVSGDVDIHSISQVQYMINEVPTVAVILTLDERSKYYNFLVNMRAHRFINSNTAIDSIVRMES